MRLALAQEVVVNHLMREDETRAVSREANEGAFNADVLKVDSNGYAQNFRRDLL
jgi:hypothetical protein